MGPLFILRVKTMLESSMLQVLIALSQNENISKAAEELNVTQSAVSQALKISRRKLDSPLSLVTVNLWPD